MMMKDDDDGDGDDDDDNDDDDQRHGDGVIDCKEFGSHQSEEQEEMDLWKLSTLILLFEQRQTLDSDENENSYFGFFPPLGTTGKPSKPRTALCTHSPSVSAVFLEPLVQLPRRRRLANIGNNCGAARRSPINRGRPIYQRKRGGLPL